MRSQSLSDLLRVRGAIRALRELRDREVAIEAPGTHRRGKHSISTARLLVAHSLGFVPGAPRRDVLSETVNQNKGALLRAQRQSVSGVVAGRSLSWAVEYLGRWYVSAFRRTILSRLSPPLRPSTMARRYDRRMIPLLDRGQLVRAVRWREVRRGQS